MNQGLVEAFARYPVPHRGHQVADRTADLVPAVARSLGLRGGQSLEQRSHLVGILGEIGRARFGYAA